MICADLTRESFRISRIEVVFRLYQEDCDTKYRLTEL